MSLPTPPLVARLQALLAEYGRKYPGCWQQYDEFRYSLRGSEVPDWPQWCYCPMAGAYAIISGGGDHKVPHDRLLDISVLSALAAWRGTQGIYRLHPSLLEPVFMTSMDREIPSEYLYCLPEWCIAVELPGSEVLGFLAHLEFDANSGRTELRFLLIQEDGLFPIIMHLTRPTLRECLDAAFQDAANRAALSGVVLPTFPDGIPQLAGSLLSVVLYVCSAASDIDVRASDGSARVPGRPLAVLTKRGPRMHPPDRPTLWDTGWRMGAALKAAHQAAETAAADGSHAGPRPHVRRAHWHSFWTGPREGDRKLTLRWLHPILVGSQTDQIVPTVRPVP